VVEDVAGHGVATATVRELCEVAATQHGLRTLRAATTYDNVASQRVLTKAGFVPDGPAEPGGKAGLGFRLDRSADPVRCLVC
jgi:ribosomal-protein-alanine N-acetyltransferase